MKLTDLYLNRFLYKNSNQNLETKDAVDVGGNVSQADVTPVASGGAAQDINTGNVYIDGNQIEPGTIPQTTLDVSNWGWGQTCPFQVSSATVVTWGIGSFKSASGVVYSIAAGTTGTMSATTYIYLDLNISDTTYQVTTTPGTAVGVGKVLIAVAKNGSTSATFNLSEATQIIGDNILANTIDASKITAGTITATQISSSYVYAGYISANNITAGTITGSTLRTASSGQRVIVDGSSNSIVFYDSSGNSFETLANGGTYLMQSNVSGGSIYSNSGSGGTVAFFINGTTAGYFDSTGFIVRNLGITFLSTSSTPSVTGRLQYYNSGGVERFQTRLAGYNFSFDLSFI